VRAAFDPVTNLRVGVQVLKECIARAGSLEAGLKYYVGAANLPDDGGYVVKVLAEQSNIRRVADGKVVAFTAPLPTPAPSVQDPKVGAIAVDFPSTAVGELAPAEDGGHMAWASR
jgi:hypothetical protein